MTISTPYTTICVSGGFDPVHIGHLRMMQEAAKYGNVIIIVNSDEWLMRKRVIFLCHLKRGARSCGDLVVCMIR